MRGRRASIAEAAPAGDNVIDLRRDSPLEPHLAVIIDDAQSQVAHPNIQSDAVGHRLLPLGFLTDREPKGSSTGNQVQARLRMLWVHVWTAPCWQGLFSR